ncbi:signal peptide-containing protein [Theileria equi strain WA]|uniref:Signal peptide-containing protein n=1 Tax=Theileria equi strain WA TaxID=1537102 RepID=L0AVF4_THEEQ|nr:signal peptide-containing protein [Theileria equi strain WA]AFZ79525.1 signal peptide-containing protein [Theileria equi strain WA]|eukprot:XP_004829191.1 signal peptide-containing protein [Theileria equi strain WA]
MGWCDSIGRRKEEEGMKVLAVLWTVYLIRLCSAGCLGKSKTKDDDNGAYGGSTENLRSSPEHAKVSSEETPVEVTPDTSLQEEMHVDSPEEEHPRANEKASSKTPTTSEDKFNVKYFEKNVNGEWKELTLDDFLKKFDEILKHQEPEKYTSTPELDQQPNQSTKNS